MDMLHSPVDDVGAGDDGSDDRNDWGSLPHPAPVQKTKKSDNLAKKKS